VAGDPSEHEFRLRGDPEAAAEARQTVRDLDTGLAPDVLDDLLLCVTELVTNCVEHAGSDDTDPVEMRVVLSDHAVRVEVGDRGSGFRSPRFSREVRDRGWGLYIVDLLADRWGVERRDLNWVWFEIGARQTSAPR
jgi:anti-sigma regulatory factor (Ser/Thr protein kinase)